MIHVYFDTTDHTYLLSYNDLISDGWFSQMPRDFYSINFESITEDCDTYIPPLLHTFNTIDNYHQYVEEHPEDFL